MKTKRAGVNAVLTQIEQSADRSSLFYWMVEHHDEMLAKAKGRKLRWIELCVTFKTLGLTNQQGEPANERAARQTWYRARKLVATERSQVAAFAATGLGPRYLTTQAPSRSRAPSSWRPEQLPLQPPAKTGPAPSLAQSSPSPEGSNPNPTQTPPGERAGLSIGQSRLADIRQALNERSGR